MKFKNMSAVVLSGVILISGMSICAADKAQGQKTIKQQKQSSFIEKAKTGAKIVGAMGVGVLGTKCYIQGANLFLDVSHIKITLGALIGLLAERSYHFYKKSLNAQVDLKNKDASLEELEDQKAKLEEERDKHIKLLAKAQAALKTMLAQQAQAEQAKEAQEQSEVTPV